MLSTTERRRLMQRVADEPAVERAMIARCIAGLAVMVLIAAIGASAPTDSGGKTLHAAQAAAQERVDRGASAHRRELFEQRRQNYMARHPQAASAESPAEVSPVAQQ